MFRDLPRVMEQVSNLSQDIQVLYELRNIQTFLMGVANTVQSLLSGWRRKLSSFYYSLH